MAPPTYEPPEFLITAGRLHAFLDRVRHCHVQAQFHDAMTLRWCPPKGRPVTIAYVSPTGFLWTDVDVAKQPWATEPAHRYVEELAAAWDLTVNRESFGVVWTVCRHDDRLPHLEDLLGTLDVWAAAIENLIDDLRAIPR